jgi:hypothetical protein
MVGQGVCVGVLPCGGAADTKAPQALTLGGWGADGMFQLALRVMKLCSSNSQSAQWMV